MSDLLQDRIAAGLGIAARKLGVTADAYRPRDATPALAPRNRYMRLPVAFHIGKGFDAPATQGAPLWQALLDSAYTKPGDYLVQGSETWFIASQPRLLPVLCVQANRIVNFTRAAVPDRVGQNAYAGMQREAHRPLLTGWPASVLATGAARTAQAHLPADLPAAQWTVLLPILPQVILRAGDRMTDDLGRAGIVISADQTAQGWRLTVREATS